MTMYDRSEIKAGMFIRGAVCPAQMFITKSRDPIRKPPKPPDFGAISDQMDAAKKKLEEIAQAVGRARRR